MSSKLVVLMAAALLTGSVAVAQSPYKPPRTASGRPDITGVWNAATLTPFERPDFEKRPFLPPDEARVFAQKMQDGGPEVTDPDFAVSDIRNLTDVRGELRTSIVVDPPTGKMPLSPEGGRLSGKNFDDFLHAYDNPEDRGPGERCVGGFGAPPIRIIAAMVPLRIVQTADNVVFSIEDADGLRIAPLHPSPRPEALRSYAGWPVARYEGDTLIVESTGFRSDWIYREQPGPSVIVGPDSKVTERFTLLSPDELLYQFTVEDPHYYTQPWRGEFVYRRAKVMTFEYACHEQNYSLRNILLGGRVEAARLAAAPPR